MAMRMDKWIKAYDNNEFAMPANYTHSSEACREEVFERVCRAGWYDWFSSDRSLIPRIERYSIIIKMIAGVRPDIAEHCVVGFKQTMPLSYKGYNDCLHIYEDEEDGSGWGIYIDNPGRQYKYEVFRYGTAVGTDAEFKSVRSMVEWFRNEQFTPTSEREESPSDTE